MDPFDLLHVHEPGPVTGHQRSRRAEAAQRQVAAFGDRLRAGGDGHGALQLPLDEGVSAVPLELALRIEVAGLPVEA